ncbi:MAG: class B sortase [Oscillospiraceae bacterium]|nr:class B sortase [Oscillospiraceae bacterium]
MDAKQNSRKGKLWMIPLSILLLAGGGVCLWMLYLALQFTMPAKAVAAQEINTPPVMDRESYVWIPPTEPEEEEEKFILPPYELHINMNQVNEYHNYNNDVIGWIRIQDTVVNYPIMQTDNNNFYVDHNWQGQPSSAGAIFADCRCDLDFTDNALVYGHNQANGSMLHAIKNYKVADWGRMHPYVEIASLSHRYLYKVLSVNVVYGEIGANFEYWNCIRMNRSRYQYYLNNIRNTAQVWYADDRHLPRDNNDRIIALQTCNSGAHDGMRCVVFAQCIGDFTNESVYDETVGRPEIKTPPEEWRP